MPPWRKATSSSGGTPPGSTRSTTIPPALSNLLDHYLEEWFWRPSAIVCYSAGSFGGRIARYARVSTAMGGLAARHDVIPVVLADPGDTAVPEVGDYLDAVHFRPTKREGVGSSCRQRELVDVGLALGNGGLVQTGRSVHAIGHLHAVPMHRRRLRQPIGDVDAHAITLDRLERGAR